MKTQQLKRTILSIDKGYVHQLVLVALLLGVLSSGYGQQILDQDIIADTLPNGFRYYIKPVTLERNDIYVGLMAPGKRSEAADQLSLAHLMEHMNVMSALDSLSDEKTFYREKLLQRTDVPTYIGASTTEERTLYNWRVPGGDPQLLAESLLRLRHYAWSADMESILQDTLLVKLRGRHTILEELNNWSGKKVQQDIYREELMLYKASPCFDFKNLAKRQIAYIKEFPLASLLRFYRTWYRPDKEVLVVIGNVNLKTIRKKIARLFGDLPPYKGTRNEVRIPCSFRKENILKGQSQVIPIIDSTRDDIQLEWYTLRYGVVPDVDKDIFLPDLYEQLLKRLFSNRMKSLKGMSSHARSFIPYSIFHLSNTPYIHDSKIRWTVRGKEDILVTLKKVFVALEQLHRDGFTVEEIASAKAEVLASFNIPLYPNDKEISEDIQHYFLAGTPLRSREQKRALVSRILDTLDQNTIKQEADKWLTAPDRSLAITLGTNVPVTQLPTAKSIDSLLTVVHQQKIAPFVHEKVAAVPKHLMAEPESKTEVILHQETFAPMGLTMLTLKNGMHIICKPNSSSKEHQIYIDGFTALNTEELKANPAWKDALNDLAKNTGAGRYSKNTVKQFKTLNKISAFFTVLDDQATISEVGSPAHIRQMLEMMVLKLKHIPRDTSVFKQWTQTAAPERRYIGDTIFNLFEIKRHEKERSIAKSTVKFDAVLQHYHKLYGNPSRWWIVITGDIKLQELKPLLCSYLGSLPAGSTAPSKKTNHDFKWDAALSKNDTLYQGNNYGIVINYAGNYTNEPIESMKLELLKLLFQNRIYPLANVNGIYIPLMVRLQKESGFYRFYIDKPKINPLQKDKIQRVRDTIVFRVLKELIAKGPTAEEVAVVQRQYKSNLTYIGENAGNRSAFINDIHLLTQHQKNYLLSKKEQWQALEKITPEELHQAFKTYLNPKRCFIYYQMPLSEKGI
ncbi:insulinase family protein [Zhouia sp. PK063]|uniref:M16 family metallopeptidase n=1 Tax=Zhouia sp. PK063 TaxID=3373602 RepID=UPI0037B4C9D3